MMPRFEKFNIVREEVIVILKVDSCAKSSKQRKRIDKHTVVLDLECGVLEISKTITSKDAYGE